MTTRTEAEVAEVPAILTPREFQQGVRAPLNWHEWLYLAKAAVTLDQKLGLLHTVFNVDVRQEHWWDEAIQDYRTYNPNDRVTFLFAVADGWKDSDNFDWRKSEELFSRDGSHISESQKHFAGYDKNGLNRIYRTDSEQRQVLARKAFNLLCQHFFIIDETPEYKVTSDDVRYRWFKNFVSGPLFPVVQQFYNVEKGNDIANLTWRGEDRFQHAKHANAFLLKLAEFLWTWKEDISWVSDKEKAAREAENARMQKLVVGARPWMIEVLDYMNELKVLRKWLVTLDPVSIKKLKEIALRCTFSEHLHPVNKERRVQSIDEACYLKSVAGWLLKQRELMIAEHTRLTKIRDNERGAEKMTMEATRLKKEGTSK